MSNTVHAFVFLKYCLKGFIFVYKDNIELNWLKEVPYERFIVGLNGFYEQLIKLGLTIMAIIFIVSIFMSAFCLLMPILVIGFGNGCFLGIHS